VPRLLLLTGAETLDVARDALTVLLLVAGPIMMIGLVIGLIIAFFQALTQIQEITLTFVPKIVAVFAGLLFLLPFIGRQMGGLMARLMDVMVSG